jgi:crossover junction endonuclease MUS81
MNVRIDIREQDLLRCINDLRTNMPQYKDLEISTEALPLGDVIISCNDEDRIIIERKSISDLLSSIKDGRYEEQSYRLNGSDHHNHNIIYIIEGDIKKYNKDKQTLYSAIFSLNYYKGFSVIRTISIEETALFICNSTIKLIKGDLSNRKQYYQNGQNGQNSENSATEQSVGTDKDYINVVKKVKKDNITPDNIYEIMLCQIPGISATTSIVIMEKFKTISNLITGIEKDPNCLKDIVYSNTKGQTRKINSNCASNIVKYLIQQKTDSTS